jgi:hypothetical protein
MTFGLESTKELLKFKQWNLHLRSDKECTIVGKIEIEDTWAN